MSRTYRIRPETAADHEAVHALHYSAFGDDEAVPNLVRDLRCQTETFPCISLIAEDRRGTPLGHVMMSHAWLDTETSLIDVMVLSPLAVRPAVQRIGVGTALLEASLKAVDDAGSPLLFLEGDHRYYGPRGFENAIALGFRRPSLRIPEKAFQVAKLSRYAQTMTGTFVYKDVHWRHGVGLYRDS